MGGSFCIIEKDKGEMMSKAKLIIGIIAIIGGLVVAGLGFLPQNQAREDAAVSWARLSSGAGKQVEGKVAAVESDAVTEGTRRSRHIETVYCPVYHYTVNDKEYEVQSVGDNCKENKDEVKVGSTAPIVYDPLQPEEAFVKTDATAAFYGDTGGSQWAGIAVGAVLVLLGVGAIFTARQSATSKQKVDESK